MLESGREPSVLDAAGNQGSPRDDVSLSHENENCSGIVLEVGFGVQVDEVGGEKEKRMMPAFDDSSMGSLAKGKELTIDRRLDGESETTRVGVELKLLTCSLAKDAAAAHR